MRTSNVPCVLTILIRRAPEVSCLSTVIHVHDSDLRGVLQESDIFARQDDQFEATFFNTYETAARVMLRELPVVAAAQNTGDKSSHFLVVGCGRMGEALLVRLIRDWCIDHANVTVGFAHYSRRPGGKPTK